MDKTIRVNGIQTNNLKNINVTLRKNAINLIIGPSGSGKSSLAYDTIAQIGLHELGVMYHDNINEPEYKIDSYSNMVVTIPIEQLNNNNNIRSTIGTYFSISPCLAKIYSSILMLPYEYFILNKSDNICPSCQGVGYTKRLDLYKIVDYDRTVEEVPIRCWMKNKDFYRQILLSFCNDEKIPCGNKFRHLNAIQQKKILYGISKKKYTIKYKTTNHFSSRTTLYYGPMVDVTMLKNFSPSAKFYSESPCQICNGEKYENGHRQYKICGYSIGELLLLPFDNLVTWIGDIRKEYVYDNIDFSLTQIEAFAKKAIELKLGYLFFNRTIPSLSGGELQRLRLIQIFNSQLTDLLIVLDEPLASLSANEKNAVYHNIIELRQKHSLLIVDHHEVFIKEAANIIALGEGGGKNGGSIIDAKRYITRQRMDFPFKTIRRNEKKHISSTNSIYDYKGIDIDIALGELNLITGPSGIGKSTLLREYFPQIFDDYLYISQKALNGNIRSTVATSIGISDMIALLFSKRFKQSRSVFLNMSSSEGSCSTCSGTGIVTLGSDVQSQLILRCKDCAGTGFNRKVTQYAINEKNIQDIWLMTIEDGVDYFKKIDEKIFQILLKAQKLLLGHLQIGEKTQKLSGGENIRVKLMTAMSSKNDIIGIDEPFKGLSHDEIYTIMLSLNELIQKSKTIIVADHEEAALRYFPNQINLKNNSGILFGVI